eukprot:TRINITY_DN89_c0_g1_i8.p3 TRINITY_DN89_c0_g1~~TRINITY_DN89_c0_g1_i8.p3  ORF type:complete len:136 (+),score=22.55 TRINITY_DN89_c0_g1_i8:51-410(+)
MSARAFLVLLAVGVCAAERCGDAAQGCKKGYVCVNDGLHDVCVPLPIGAPPSGRGSVRTATAMGSSHGGSSYSHSGGASHSGSDASDASHSASTSGSGSDASTSGSDSSDASDSGSQWI